MMFAIRHCPSASLLSSLLLVWGGISTPSQAEAPTNLFQAVERSNSTAIAKLIENGADPNELNERGNTALHEAILRNDAKVVQALMASGADAKIRNRQGYSSGFLCSVIRKNTALTALVMGAADDSADVVPYPLASFGSLPQGPREFTSPASLIQWNPRFGYRFFASPFWKLQGIQQDGTFENQSIVVVSLPALWSALENRSIENAISVYAKERETINSLDLAVEDFLARNPSAKSSEPIVAADAAPKRTKFTYEQVDSGLTYKKQSVVVFNNGFYYQMDFTATPGTFDENLPVFTAFCEAIEFIKKALPDDVKPKGQQGGAGQPANRSESKSEDGDKPQPESEGRSR